MFKKLLNASVWKIAGFLFGATQYVPIVVVKTIKLNGKVIRSKTRRITNRWFEWIICKDSNFNLMSLKKIISKSFKECIGRLFRLQLFLSLVLSSYFSERQKNLGGRAIWKTWNLRVAEIEYSHFSYLFHCRFENKCC